MATSRLLSPPSTTLLFLRSSRRSTHRKVWFFHRRRPQVRVFASAGGGEGSRAAPEGGAGGGGSVDEGMPTLWQRIGELKGEEERCKGGRELLPVELSRLEREEDAYTLYKSEMLEVLGLLQLRPEGERVKVEMGVTVMVKLLLPTSVLVVMLHLMDAAKVILDGMQQKSPS